jgi:hypothetical protein
MAIMDFVHDHPIIVIGGAIAVAFLVIPKVLQAGQSQINAQGNASTMAGATNNASDLSGLTNGGTTSPVAYIPTTTNFTTTNNTTDSVLNSPNSNAINPAISYGNSTPVSATIQTPPTPVIQPRRPMTYPSTTVDNGSVPVVSVGPIVNQVNPPAVLPNDSHPPRQGTPVPIPAPTTGQLVWNQNYTIKSGDTLSGIASSVTAKVRNQGMPTSMNVSFNDIYAHNKPVIDANSAAHGNPVKGFATPQQVNNIFPGEVITLPVWGK